MKKLFSFILIVFILGGILAPSTIVSAAGTLGYCSTANANKTQYVDYVNKTSAECTALKPTNGSVIWQPYGTCTITSADKNTVQDITNQTQAECSSKKPAGGSAIWKESVPVTPGGNPPAGGSTSNTTYQLLSPLPCPPSDPNCTGNSLSTYDTGDDNQLSRYLNVIIKIFIGICAVLAMIMIVIGGLEYITSELPGNKEDGKNRITQAILGLVLAICAWLILYTINPALLDANLHSLENVKVEVELAEDNIQATAANPACVEADMISITLFGKSGVKVNKKVVPVLRGIEAAWLAKGGNNFYKINTVFGYNCRPVRGVPNVWSAHAFGLALDINEATNPMGKTLVTDMETSKFYQLFTAAGWGWGGAWRRVKDTMHFSSNNR